MAKETKIDPSVYVVTFGDYLAKVGATEGNKVVKTIEMIYSENNVVDKLERKGEIFFVCKK